MPNVTKQGFHQLISFEKFTISVLTKLLPYSVQCT